LKLATVVIIDIASNILILGSKGQDQGHMVQISKFWHQLPRGFWLLVQSTSKMHWAIRFLHLFLSSAASSSSSQLMTIFLRSFLHPSATQHRKSKHCTLYISSAADVYNKLCAWRHDMPPPFSSPVGAQAPRAPPSRSNVKVKLAHLI